MNTNHRRNLDYHDVLDSLSSKGIAIRVASPKLVMEEVNTDVMFITTWRELCRESSHCLICLLGTEEYKLVPPCDNSIPPAVTYHHKTTACHFIFCVVIYSKCHIFRDNPRSY